ncbi:G-protein coupled receptor GRL101-like [Diadema setosum]|uniref:G-protein coupled receptor GRL101-like n=1 Tax=Diadema setosum TaxID=31175 RepID=UPI003B3A273F
MSQNCITSLPSAAFKGVDSALMLSLGDNDITEIEPEAFHGLSRLLVLSTSDTRLCCLVANSTNCTSTVPTNPLDTCGSLFPSVVLRVFGWLMGLTALIGNCVVLYLRLFQAQESKVQNRLIASLALADCVMAVYMLIITSADLRFASDYFLNAPLWRNSGLCRFAGFLAFLSSEASVISLTLITIDRFVCIVFPFGGWKITTKWCRIMLCITWLSVFVISLPTLIDNSKIPDFYGQSDVCIGLPLHLSSGGTGVLVTTKETEWSRDFTVTFESLSSKKRPPWIYSIVVFICMNLLSFIFIAVCYIVMFVKVRRSGKESTNTASRSREIKMARRMAILIGTDLTCWMPIILMGILSQTGTVTIPTSLYAWSVIFILPINSSLNPMLYTFMSYSDKGKRTPRSK